MNPDHFDELLDYLQQQSDRAALHKAVQALLTDTEQEEICNRLQIFKLLQSGMPQRQIAETLGVGIATVTRGSNALKKMSDTIPTDRLSLLTKNPH